MRKTMKADKMNIKIELKLANVILQLKKNESKATRKKRTHEPKEEMEKC